MSPNCLFELVKKDKTHRNRARNVLLKPSKGQIDFYPGPKCLFELVKRTEHAAYRPETSF